MQRNVSGRELYMWLVTNCLFVLLTRSRCYRRVRVFGSEAGGFCWGG